MQGLRPYSLQQDENSVFAHRGLQGKAPLAGEAFAKGTPLAGFPSARKALGDISNRRQLEGGDNGLLPSKTPARPGPARKALGDITNAASVVKAPLQQAARPPLGEKPALAAAPAAAARPSDRAAQLAGEAAERSAGAGWHKLEAARLERQGREVEAALDAVLPAHPRAMPTFFPLWVRGRALAASALGKQLHLPPPGQALRLASVRCREAARRARRRRARRCRRARPPRPRPPSRQVGGPNNRPPLCTLRAAWPARLA